MARQRLRVWVIVGSLLLASCAAPPPSPPSPSTTAVWHAVTLGWCEDYPEETRSLEAAREDLRAAHEAGAEVLRIAFGWDAMEPERGHYDWSFWDEFVRIAVEEFGIRLIPYVCYTPQWAASANAGDDFWRSPPRDPEDFARFMTALVDHYQHAIHSWELWNEPDNRAYWLGTREQFATLVRTGSRAVRAADPTATVVLGGIAGDTDFLDALFRTDRIAPAVDVVNLHSYFETWHPDAIEWLPDYVSRAAEIVRDQGENEPLWMAETGYSSVGGRAVVSEVYRARHRDEHTDHAQAVALARTFVVALATGELPVVAWYRINDLPTTEAVIGDDNNRHLGLRTTAGVSKPALTTFALLTRWFQQPYRILIPTVHPISAADATASPVEVHAFALRDGRKVIAAWLGTPAAPTPPPSAVQSSATPAELPTDSRHTRIRVTLPETRAAAVRVTDVIGQPVSGRLFAWHNRLRRGVDLDLELRGGELLLAELRP